MTYLKSQGVPLIPAVLDWSAAAPSSPRGCEYVLMERAAGVELRQIWDSLTEREQTAYNQQLADWVRSVGALPRPAPAGVPLIGNAGVAPGPPHMSLDS